MRPARRCFRLSETRSPMYRWARSKVVRARPMASGHGPSRSFFAAGGACGRLRGRASCAFGAGSSARGGAGASAGAASSTAGQRALVEELHVHRVVLEERRARDHGDVVVPLGEEFGDRVELELTPLDRGQAELPGAVELDAREVRVEVAVARLHELVDERSETSGLSSELRSRAAMCGRFSTGTTPLTWCASSRISSREPKTSGARSARWRGGPPLC